MAELEKVGEFKSGVYYRTTCSCMSEDELLTIEITNDEYVDELMYTSIIFHYNCSWDSIRKRNFILRIWERIKCSLKMLFTGRVEAEGEFIFRSENHIKELLDTLNKEYKKYKKKSKKCIQSVT